MKLIFPDKSSAQARADKLHADMIANDPLYAISAQLYTDSKGVVGTARWCFPTQDLDKSDKPTSANWNVTVQDRCQKVLTASEVQAVPELAAKLISKE